MRPFVYETAGDEAAAIRAGRETGAGPPDAKTQYLAGGTTLIDLMKLEVLRPSRVVDINALAARHGAIEADANELHLGALARMSQAATDPLVQRDFPAIAQALDQAASQQLRNMASLGGNVLQRTRCSYFRDPSWTACNKRTPGSGCAAMDGVNRNFAILGVNGACIAQYPGDFAVALVAFDADAAIIGPSGARRLKVEALHRDPGVTPHIETNLMPGELVVGFHVPVAPWTRRSLYLKIRDRASYEFALCSAAVALELDGGTIRQARIALGGMAYRPWRAREAEAALTGKAVTSATMELAADLALKNATTHGGNAFKPLLARRTITRALLEAGRLEI